MDAWQYLQELCALPPRGAASEGERQAAEWLRRRLAGMGYQVETQPFRSPRKTLYTGPLVVIAVMLLAAGLSARWPGGAVLLSGLGLVPLIGELLGARRVNFDLVLPKGRSENVIARRRAEGEAGRGRPFVIVAHYDTQWGSILFAPAFRPFLRPFFLLVYAGFAVTPVSLVLRWAAPAWGWVRTILWAAAADLAAAGLFLLLALVTGRAVQGANDNGSGVAVALALAERWRTEGPAGFEPVFLFTGCEEAGLRGMHHFLSAAPPPKETVFINLDNVGGGTLRYLRGEGMLVHRRYDPALVRLAEELAKEYPGVVAPLDNLLLPTDGLLPAKAGYPTLTFLAAGDDGWIPDYHWHSDTLENADRMVVELTETFVAGYLEALPRALGPEKAAAAPGR